MWTWIVVGAIFVGFVLVASISGAYDKHPSQNSTWWKKTGD
jgi:hypothetical protein